MYQQPEAIEKSALWIQVFVALYTCKNKIAQKIEETCYNDNVIFFEIIWVFKLIQIEEEPFECSEERIKLCRDKRKNANNATRKQYY